jgi:hypothetical protein
MGEPAEREAAPRGSETPSHFSNFGSLGKQVQFDLSKILGARMLVNPIKTADTAVNFRQPAAMPRTAPYIDRLAVGAS